MKASLYGKSLILVGAILMAQGARGQCEGALAWSEVANLSSGGGLPAEAFSEVRPDLSNPGARALALGGAFIATADDSTSVIANPAGLGAIVRPGLQAEARASKVVQYDRFGAAGLQSKDEIYKDRFLQTDSSLPFFVSGVYPIGDKVVLGAFYQRVFDSGNRTVDRITTGNPVTAGPCYGTKSTRGVDVKVLVPLYRLKDDTSISRMGASVALRAAPGLSVGATVFLASESRVQKAELGDATGAVYEDSLNRTGQLDVSSNKPGFLVGVQYSPSDSVRVGAVWASSVIFDDENPANQTTPGTPALRKTVLPMRLGAGLSWNFHPRWSASLDGVYVQTSSLRDEMNLEDARLKAALVDPASFTQGDSYEARLGLEWTAVQTRTTAFTVRAGGWMQTASNLKFFQEDPTFQNTYYYDALRVVFPRQSDPTFVHVTGGLGLVSQKRWQFDVGVDYELETETTAFSGLVGYTF